MKHEYWTCDIDGCSFHDKAAEVSKNKKLQVVFHTEQTEGRMVPPHLTTETLDICQNCLNRIVAGEALQGSGAQGHNKYWFKKG